MTFQEALIFLDSFINYEKSTSYNYKDSLKLERTCQLLDLLGNPQKGIRALQIAGTKGKGSTAATVAAILQKAGFTTALYTSPHLSSFTERIQINGREILEEAIAALIERIRPATDAMRRSGTPPSFFEVYTAIAFLYFKMHAVDFMVLETGLGGRLDATTAADACICGITQISYEHMDKLGSTLSEITFEKASIIKDGAIVISSVQEAEAQSVIEAESLKKHAKLFTVGKDLFFESTGFGIDGQECTITGRFGTYKNIRTPLLGDHQLMNITTAVGMVEALQFFDSTIPEAAIRDGIRSTVWPGRIEIVKKEPRVVVDGAQNRASAHALREAVKKYFRFSKLILVIGVSKDKDIAGIEDELSPIADTIIVTQAHLARALDARLLADYFKKKVFITQSVPEAVDRALAISEKNDLVLITGSLFVVGEAREMFVKRTMRDYAKI